MVLSAHDVNDPIVGLRQIDREGMDQHTVLVDFIGHDLPSALTEGVVAEGEKA